MASWDSVGDTGKKFYSKTNDQSYPVLISRMPWKGNCFQTFLFRIKMDLGCFSHLIETQSPIEKSHDKIAWQVLILESMLIFFHAKKGRLPLIKSFEKKFFNLPRQVLVMFVCVHSYNFGFANINFRSISIFSDCILKLHFRWGIWVKWWDICSSFSFSLHG